MLAEGKLPHLAALRDQGCFRPLGSTRCRRSRRWPGPRSRPATNPGKHNIFDFLTPDLHTYQPKLSSVEIRPPRRDPPPGQVSHPPRQGRRAAAAQEPAVLERPERPRHLQQHHPRADHLPAGEAARRAALGDVRARPPRHAGHVLPLHDPPPRRGREDRRRRPHRRPRGRHDRRPTSSAPTTRSAPTCGVAEGPVRGHGHRARTGPILKIDGAKHELQQGQYTEWVRVGFRVAPGVKVHGVCKFLLLETEPEFGLYVTPVNIDPEKPGDAGRLSGGLLRCTWPRSRGRSPRSAWPRTPGRSTSTSSTTTTSSQQCLDADREREAMFFDALDKVPRGLCVVRLRRHRPHPAHVLARHRRPTTPPGPSSTSSTAATSSRTSTGAWTTSSAGRWRSATATTRC